MRFLAGVAASLLLLLALAVWLWQDSGGARPGPVLPLTGLLGGAADPGFQRADTPGSIRLPADHGPHPGFQSEWWYFTGNLEAEDGAEFGFQLTFFRYALAADSVPRPSPWATRQVYMAHLAVTDRQRAEHQAAERLARPAAGLAGAAARPFAVWLDDWSARSTGSEFLPLRLRAADPDTGVSLDLRLGAGRPAVLQGDRGLSAKGELPGNASYYYSYTRLPVTGTLQIAGRSSEVSGLAWMDREWSTSSLEAGTIGWDWFALQLADGRDVMIYGLRDMAGRMQAASAGKIVGPGDEVRALAAGDFALRPLRWWTSPATGVSWPVAWSMSVPSAALDVEVRGVLDDQEQLLSVLYWEGSVDVLPRGGGQRLGRGYLEMTGYPALVQPNSER